MLKDEKVVVTGGAGFIGTHLVHGLMNEGAEVHIVDNISGGKESNINSKAVFHKVDVRNLKDLVEVFKGATYVFHLAALPRVQYSIENPIETAEINAQGTLHVLEVARLNNVKRVIFSSSSSVYGNQEKMPLVETMNTDPLSPYALHKLEGEFMGKMYSRVYNLQVVSLRYFNVYGPGIDPEGSYPLAIAYFLKRRSEGKTLTITGDGTQTRDFTHVRDVVRANILAATGKDVGRGEVINIGSGKNVSMLKVAELIGGPIEHIPPRFEPKNTLADHTLATKLLGWKPEVPFEEGIAELKKLWNIA
jgi:UDP-glucose 4-epimerase